MLSPVGGDRTGVARCRRPPTPSLSARKLPPSEPARPASTGWDLLRPLAAESEAPRPCSGSISWAACASAPCCLILPAGVGSPPSRRQRRCRVVSRARQACQPECSRLRARSAPLEPAARQVPASASFRRSDPASSAPSRALQRIARRSAFFSCLRLLIDEGFALEAPPGSAVNATPSPATSNTNVEPPCRADVESSYRSEGADTAGVQAGGSAVTWWEGVLPTIR